ncbi:MAG: type VI secretion system baseplate subunit TssK [Pirellulaceae bacterium]|nr:type VI secretion system baseplate subunit TssK [Pirellulaceae bacterium]
MFLRPHHFQAADRHLSELVSTQNLFDHPYGYGVQGLSISAEALAAGTLEIRGLRARLKDGTVINQGTGQVDRIELAKRIDLRALGNAPLLVYLAVASMQEGRPNVSLTGPSVHQRYSAVSLEADDEVSGHNRQEVSLRRLNVNFMFSTDDLSGFETLPILRLIKDPADESLFRIDPSYFPPALSVQSWPELAEVMRAIYDILVSRNQTLAAMIKDKGITLSSQSPGDMEKIILLHLLNESIGELTCLAFASGVHPLVAYTSLCRIVGQCSLFGERMLIESVPRYNHEDLATIFRWAMERIRKLIMSVKEDECEQRYFVGAGRGMHVNLEPEWFGAEWDWYFGVDPINIGKDECYRLLKGPIDWKLGSSDKVEEYMTLKKPGVTMKAVQQVPRALPNRGNWVFFQIKREEDAWKHVQLTQTMAMRVRVEQISNLASLEGARRLRLAINGQAYGLEFAIFAVRKRV